jgi:hypothetical protein
MCCQLTAAGGIYFDQCRRAEYGHRYSRRITLSHQSGLVEMAELAAFPRGEHFSRRKRHDTKMEIYAGSNGNSGIERRPHPFLHDRVRHACEQQGGLGRGAG